METSTVINNINSQSSDLTYAYDNASESLQNSQSQTLNENSNLSSYANSISTNVPFSSQTITIDPNFQTAWTNIGTNIGTIEYTNLYGDKIEEIKSFAEEEIKRIDDNIDSVVKLMKNAKEDTQAFNNLLQSLIGRKQAMVDIIKIIEKENNI